jgi:hypothetical protein
LAHLPLFPILPQHTLIITIPTGNIIPHIIIMISKSRISRWVHIFPV